MDNALEIRAAISRAHAIVNLMNVLVRTLEDDGETRQFKVRALARIDAAWAALQDHDGDTLKRIALIEAVDEAARGTAAGSLAGEAVLSQLPEHLLVPLRPHCEAIGALVEAWRRKTGGRQGVSKFKQLASIWGAAMGTEPTPASWQALAKEVARLRKERRGSAQPSE